MNTMLQDFKYGLRMLCKHPSFTAVAVLTLALGIGASTAVFSVVNAVLIRPLRFPEPQRLMVILSANKDGQAFESAQGVFLDWRDRTATFETIAGARSTEMILINGVQAHRVSVAATSFDFFRLIGLEAIIGRLFTKDEDQAGRGAVAVLDAGFWHREFGANPNILGRRLVLDDKPYTVVGIVPATSHFGYFGAADIWIPMAANPSFRSGGDVVVLGRLRPGVTRGAAQAEMDAIMQQIRHEHQQDSETYVAVRPLRDWIVGDVRQIFLVLLGAVSLVLLICCANIANLQLARFFGRQKEMAIRAALGAGRGRLVRQVLVESVTLSMLGGAGGIILAQWVVAAIPEIRTFYLPRVDEISVDRTTLLVTTIVTLATGILCALAPALEIGRRDIRAALQQSEALSVAHPGGLRLRSLLVVAQLALAFTLLSGAGLMTNTLLRLLNIDLGFERDHILTIRSALPYQKYDRNRRADFERRLAAQVSRMPGVKQVSATDYLPLEAVLYPYDLRTRAADGSRHCEGLARNVDANYVAVMGIPLLAGRDFQPEDDTRTPVPVLISRTTASVLFGRENPIGKHISTNYRSRAELEVVGAVGDARQIGLTEPPGPQIYLPLVYGLPSYVVARVDKRSGDLSAAIRAVAPTLDSEVPPPEVGTLDDLFFLQIAKPRFFLILFGSFAAAGLVLAAVGVYGLISYTVAQRTREFGIRMAFGAGRKDILQLVLAAGARLTIAGSGLGVAGALAADRLISTLLYGVKPGDPLTLAVVLVSLACLALAAAYVPARRATTVDPMVALRHE